MPAKFILVRHAEGTHNLAAETEGDAAYANEANRDARLTGKGALQAQDAGKKIAENWPNVTAVWCSPLTRCIQTAKHIMKSVKVPSNSIFVHDYLIERQRKKDICNFRAEAKDIQEEWPEFSTEFIPDVASHWILLPLLPELGQPRLLPQGGQEP